MAQEGWRGGYRVERGWWAANEETGAVGCAVCPYTALARQREARSVSAIRHIRCASPKRPSKP